jgi:hypothetical protein
VAILILELFSKVKKKKKFQLIFEAILPIPVFDFLSIKTPHMHEYILPYRKLVSFLFVHRTATSTKPREHKKNVFFFVCLVCFFYFFIVKSNNRCCKVERALLEEIIISLYFVAKCATIFKNFLLSIVPADTSISVYPIRYNKT